MKRVNIAIVGIGNCASALIQGLHYYCGNREQKAVGLMNWNLGDYLPSDIHVVAAFDIDKRKVGLDVNHAIFAPPNCTQIFNPDLPPAGVMVKMGAVLDGVASHMEDYDVARRFELAALADATMSAVTEELRNSGAQILVNFLPVGAQQATEFYVNCALEAGLGVVNCIPVFIASEKRWVERFAARGLPIIGDDVKSQVGATIVHRTLTDLFSRRGVTLERTYQLNSGGNTDFLNMLDRSRLISKKRSKTEAVQAVADNRLDDDNIHIGPSDYVPWQKDNKVGFIRMEGKLFGDIPMNLELRLSVEDSPNSAGVVIDAIRCVKLALDRGLVGALQGPSAFFCKHPPQQFTDDQAHRMVVDFIASSSLDDSFQSEEKLRR